MLIEDVKWRLACGHDCECLEREEANLERAPDELIGATERWRDILEEEGESQSVVVYRMKIPIHEAQNGQVKGVTNMMSTGRCRNKRSTGLSQS